MGQQYAEQQGLNLFCDLSTHYIYVTLNAKNQFRAPTEWGVVLRPACLQENTSTTSHDAAGDPAGGSANLHSSQELRCFACDSERVRSCWLTAMRLAKYGKQLKENYKAFKNKQAESLNHREYNSFTVPHSQFLYKLFNLILVAAKWIKQLHFVPFIKFKWVGYLDINGVFVNEEVGPVGRKITGSCCDVLIKFPFCKLSTGFDGKAFQALKVTS
ncbi:unnamed protein product [Brassicogethes aeneus]|uniref:PH domain-containing protein n=1 Tax=Brassicogethes aeneus TaxID=1431903 RepID=A0A9P0FIM4_BRAAE|nr:unnamed protein product [Brassicogethes aeneus]